MRRRDAARVVVVAAVAAALAVGCQTTGSTKKRAHGGAQPAQAFFWEAQSPDGGKLFLLGSVHIGDGRELAFDPRIETDWQTAQELVVELDTTSTSPVDAVDATNRHGMLPAPHTLKEIVRADTYKQVTDYMKQRDYSMDRVDQMRPWFVALIVQDLEYGAAGLRTDNGVDAVLLRRAKDHKPIVSLTTLDEQTATFAAMPDALQETWLTDQLRDSQNLRVFTADVLQAWQAGDDDKMGALLFPDAGNPDRAQFYDRFYANRNQIMTERLAALTVDQKPRFVALGAGYLLGPHGIPELLAQRGFTVRRMGGVANVVGPPTATAAIAPAARRAAAPPAPAPAAIPSPAPTPAPTPAPAAIASPAPAPAAPPAAIAAPDAPGAAASQPPASPSASSPTPQAVAQPSAAPAPTKAGVARRNAAPASPKAAVAQPTVAPAPPKATVDQPASPAPTVAQPESPAAPAVRREVHDQWLGQDVSPPAGAPAPAAPAPAPAAAAPAPAAPAPAAQPKSAPTAKSAPTGKSATASSGKSAAQKTAAKKPSVQKTPAKKTPAKKPATKPAAKKAAETAPTEGKR